MDVDRFDALTISMATARNRRSLLRGLGVLLGGALAARSQVSMVAAQNTCTPSGACPAPYCSAASTTEGDCVCRENGMFMLCSTDGCNASSDCQNGATCLAMDCNGDGFAGHCVPLCTYQGAGGGSDCPAGQTMCSGTCTDLQSDVHACGKCGVPCGGGEGEPGHVWACNQGTCAQVCADNADYCGDRCTDFNYAWADCGGCGKQCASNEQCMNGACKPYGAPADVPLKLISQTCPDYPQNVIEPPYNIDTGKTYPMPDCTLDTGVTIKVTDTNGNLLGQCDTVDGICTVNVPEKTNVTILDTAIAQRSDPFSNPVQEVASASLTLAVFVNVTGAASAPQTTLAAAGDLPKSGQLLYGAKSGQHWDVWLHDFATGKETQLTSEVDSDQWSPVYSHNGQWIAYLSDQQDGTNQIWIMHPDGSNQRQLSHDTDSGQIMEVAWSSDDSRLIATRVDGSEQRLMVMPSSGGALTSFVQTWSSFATTGGNGTLAYVAQDPSFGTSIVWTPEKKPAFDTNYITASQPGNGSLGSPNLSPDGGYIAWASGTVGTRRIKVFKYGGGHLPDIPYSGGDDSNPVWSPDHLSLAFVTELNGNSGVFVHKLSAGANTPGVAIQVAPHDKVWYLSWRPTS